jgi:D-arabinan exo alpha-(1,3)/(1,5)-arabinofuranosidase (non-reducing end)
MTKIKKGLKARQVTTHTHDSVPVKPYKQFKDVGHWDFKKIRAGESWEFPMMEGPGCVTSIWMTVAGRLIEAVRRTKVPAHKYLWINVYYDGCEKPAISAPMGHFFGNGTTKYVHFDSKFVGMTSGGYYSFFPMPFEKFCRVVMENRHTKKNIPFFFGAIGYVQMPKLDPDTAFLHAQYQTSDFVGSKDVKGDQVPNNPHVILDENSGPGHFAGTTLTFYPNHPIKSRFKGPYFAFPYLEGNLKVYIDDEVRKQDPEVITKPVGSSPGSQSIECTGVEDYFLSGFYYITGPFSSLYHGCPVRSQLTGVVSQYRFHEADPYPWNDRVRITITHGEFDHVDCKMESLAFYYKKIKM